MVKTYRSLAAAIGVAWFFAVLGCAPAVVLENPKQWPQDYSQRQLYTTPNAHIYASGEIAAGEADRLIISVAKDFKQMTGRKGTNGVMFVTDQDDRPLVANLKKLIDLEVRKQSIEAKSKQGAKGKTEDPLEKWNEAQKKLEELGLSMDMVLNAMPAPIPDKAASLFMGLPREMTDKSLWIMVMPTKALIRGLVKKMIVAGIEKQDFGPMGKAMAGLLLGIVNIERTVTDGFAMTRDVVLFSIWVNAQPDWSEKEKKQKIDAYVEKKREQTLGGFVAGKIKDAEAGNASAEGKDAAPPETNKPGEVE